MDQLLSPKWSLVFIIYWLFDGVTCNSVEQKIYIELNHTVPCVRLLNATHQIGCQSSISGDVGVIHVLDSEDNLDWVLSTGPTPPYMVIMEAQYFTRPNMLKLKTAPGRVAGVAVIAPSANPADGFSPHTKCPNENTGVYSESYDPSLAHCNTTVWNPDGNGLSYEEFGFPVFSLKNDNETEFIRQCYQKHNQIMNNGTPEYPLCAMQLFSHMHAVTDTATCMRRNDINFSFSINPEMVCDPLGDYNVWSSTKAINNSAGHKENESVVIAAARLDSRSFFSEVGPGAESGVSGFITLLAAAHALRDAVEEADLPRTILYAFFQGEAFDYIGSSRMVYEMEHKQFAIDLDNVHSVLEVGQVGLRNGPNLWLHSDPVSRRNGSVDVQVKSLLENLERAALNTSVTVGEPGVSQPLPPSSFQRFLRARPIPGVVIAAHRSSFHNRYYESMYDNAANLNLTYPQNPPMSPEEQLAFVTETAKALAEVASTVARSLYLQAGGLEAQLPNINADPQIVTRLLYGFLVRSNNSFFQALLHPELQRLLKNEPPEYYVGVWNSPSHTSTPTVLVQYLLANLTGTVVNITRENCQGQKENDKAMYSYLWVQGVAPSNGTEREGYCVRSSVRLSKAVSPAFDILSEYSSKDYSTWTESRWKFIRARVFLVASNDLEMLTLGVGIAILITSLLLTYAINSKAEMLFSSGREPTNATY